MPKREPGDLVINGQEIAGREIKGGENSPNTTILRPPAPQGSGGVQISSDATVKTERKS